MLEDLKKNKDRVLHLLEHHPELRDDDKKLWLKFMVTFHALETALGRDAYKKLEQFMLQKNIPHFESVRRVRQKIQEEGQFRGKKWAERQEEAGVVHEFFSKDLF